VVNFSVHPKPWASKRTGRLHNQSRMQEKLTVDSCVMSRTSATDGGGVLFLAWLRIKVQVSAKAGAPKIEVDWHTLNNFRIVKMFQRNVLMVYWKRSPVIHDGVKTHFSSLGWLPEPFAELSGLLIA
jgi:hypothetical protein